MCAGAEPSTPNPHPTAGWTGSTLVARACIVYKIPLDIVTLYFVMGNFAVGGIVCMFWPYGMPQVAAQWYAIATAVIMAFNLSTQLPGWSAWTALVALAVWDLFAVLSPCGPLKWLITLVQKRKDPLPGLLYTAHVKEEEGVAPPIKLGLGDLVFYSVLVAQAAQYDFCTAVACFIAILAGLCAPLALLVLTGRALPALPISIMLGVVFFFTTRMVVTPMVAGLAESGVTI